MLLFYQRIRLFGHYLTSNHGHFLINERVWSFHWFDLFCCFLFQKVPTQIKKRTFLSTLFFVWKKQNFTENFRWSKKVGELTFFETGFDFVVILEKKNKPFKKQLKCFCWSDTVSEKKSNFSFLVWRSEKNVFTKDHF